MSLLMSPVVGSGGGGATVSSTSSLNVLSTTNNIVGTSVGATTLYTVPLGKTFVFVQAVLRLTEVAGGGGVPVVLIYDPTSGNNITSSTSLFGLTTVEKFYTLTPTTASYLVPVSNVVQISVGPAATYTTYVFSVDLIGYLV